MAYLKEICFDNSRRLRRKRYLFEYRSVRFKLVQDNPRKWADHLLTILPVNERGAHERAFSAASEFLSALAWRNNAVVALWEAGGGTWPDAYSLLRAEPRMFDFPRIPFAGNVIGYDPGCIPHVQNENQRIALALFREANASNNAYLSFLFFWQVMEANGGKPDSYVDTTFRKHLAQLRVTSSDINGLPLGGRSLGNYFLDDCRHAIAHIRRKPGKKNLDLDKPDERTRLAISVRLVKAFAEHYIREALGLTNYLYLVRRKRGDFPTFVGAQMLQTGIYKEAYPASKNRTLRMTRRQTSN